MEIIRTIPWMKQIARQARDEGRLLGLVPTMGALHAGHHSLVERARKDCSKVVASIFVNPAQFGPSEDFAKYPRSFESDAERLERAGVDYLFAPEASEVYPEGFSSYVTVEGLSDRLEGSSRPGHFRGVVTVVLKLLEIVQPDHAYFGRKDAQQVRIIAKMAEDLNLDPEIVTCPIVREPDGLALSSRNVYLDPEERKAAAVLHRALGAAREELASGVRKAAPLREVLARVLSSESLARTDYAEIVDAKTFLPVVQINKPSFALLAVRIGKNRLIDNLYAEPAGRDADRLLLDL